MGAVWFGVSHPTVGLWGRLVFVFRLVSKRIVGGWRAFFVPSCTWGYVGWGGVRMGRYVVLG
jgi:hypothetical protein